MPHLVLYDGVCGLCDHFVQFLLRIDRHDRLRFAALQGPIGAQVLKAHGQSATEFSTVIVIPNYDPRMEVQPLLERSDGALFAIASVGGFFGAARAFTLVPRVLRDAVYNLIARSRYRVFGRFDACPMPKPETRAKFLDFVPKSSAASPSPPPQ